MIVVKMTMKRANEIVRTIAALTFIFGTGVFIYHMLDGDFYSFGFGMAFTGIALVVNMITIFTFLIYALKNEGWSREFTISLLILFLNLPVAIIYLLLVIL